MITLSGSDDIFKFITKALSDIYAKIDSISSSLEALNDGILELKKSIGKISGDISSRIEDLESEKDKLRKEIIEKTVNLENKLLSEIENSLGKIKFEDVQFVEKTRKLYNNMKTIAWLVQLSSLGKILSKIFD